MTHGKPDLRMKSHLRSSTPFRLARRTLFAAACIAALTTCGGGGGSENPPAASSLDKVKTIVVIYLENRSFDNLYGMFPGANGVANALTSPGSYLQSDRDGTVMAKLPPVWSAGGASSWSFVAELPNQPFRIDAPNAGSPGVPLSVITPDLVHRFYQNQMQLNGGLNNQYAAWSDAGGLAMGYYDGSPMRLWKLAQQYTLADNFFQGAHGGSFLNHFWLVCACTPELTNPPPDIVSSVDASGTRLNTAANSPASARSGPALYVKDGQATPKLADGKYYAINTMQPAYQPSATPPPPGGDPRLADPNGSLAPQTGTTIGDTLSAKGVNWKWYAGGWNQALADRNNLGEYEPHHQPFPYFKRFDPTTASGAADRSAHLKDYTDLVADIQSGSLPPVAFYKPVRSLTQHPGEADITSGDAHVADLVAQLQASAQWKDMLIVITYDEFGGFWDHVAPPKADQWGPGPRIPALIVSPYARKGYIDRTPYDTTSIIKLISRRFGLDALPGVRKDAGDLSNALQ
jgi:acid phosphatase